MTDDNKTQARGGQGRLQLFRILILASMAGLFLTACGEQRFEAREAQDFTLPTLVAPGEPVSLSDYRGDVVYLTFWASWCVPCKQEMPYLAQLWERHHADGLQIIGINVDEDIDAAKQFAADHDLPFPLVRDEARSLSELYGVPGYPTHYLVDRNGKIRFSGIGFNLNDVAAVTQEIETLLVESGDATN